MFSDSTLVSNISKVRFTIYQFRSLFFLSIDIFIFVSITYKYNHYFCNFVISRTTRGTRLLIYDRIKNISSDLRRLNSWM